jgi:hypothetical protein
MPQSPIADPLAWRAVTAPSLVDFEILANEVYRGLPKKFRTLCEDLVIRIEDFATDEILNDMESIAVRPRRTTDQLTPGHLPVASSILARTTRKPWRLSAALNSADDICGLLP